MRYGSQHIPFPMVIRHEPVVFLIVTLYLTVEEVETACLFEYDLRFQRMLASEDCYLLSKHNKSKTTKISSCFKVVLVTRNLS